ncbi:MAG: hypothetical protein JNK60_01705 [Acidobacteria bacterium]|nr:hypothetical protein [Acidobacteriota bacterium]
MTQNLKSRGAFLALLYAFIAVGLPVLHLARHKDDHVHEGAGMKRLFATAVSAASFGAAAGEATPHVHADGSSHAPRERLALSRVLEVLVPSRAPHGHGDGGAAHFAEALGDGSSPDLPLFERHAFVTRFAFLESSASTLSPPRGPPADRGPPARAFETAPATVL